MTKHQGNDDYTANASAEVEAETDRDTPDDKASIAEIDLAGSRAAMLSLIDRLARRSVPMLSLIGVAAMSIAGFYSLNLPGGAISAIGRMMCWLALVLGCLVFAAHRLHLFRQGFAYNGRPFTWRAHYTATLSVLGTSFGIGAILLTPGSMSLSVALLICGAFFIASVIFGIGHIAHQPAAAAAGIPPAIISLAAAIFHIMPLPAEQLQRSMFVWCAGVAALIIVVFWARAEARKVIASALRDHPRNEFLHIAARHKKISAGYNPFTIRAQKTQKNPAEVYKPSEL